MASTTSYYCYQCADRVQADMFTFTCTRCGGGFIQEMPEERSAPPPLIDLAESTSDARAGSGPSSSVGGLPAAAPQRAYGPASVPPVSQTHSGVQTQPSGVFSPNLNYAMPFNFVPGVNTAPRPQSPQQQQGQYFFMPVGAQPGQPVQGFHRHPVPHPQNSYGNQQRFGTYQNAPQGNFFPGQFGGSPVPQQMPAPQQGGHPGQVTMVQQIDIEVLQTGGRGGVPRVREVIVSEPAYFALGTAGPNASPHALHGQMNSHNHRGQGIPFQIGQPQQQNMVHPQHPQIFQGQGGQPGEQNGMLVVGIQGDENGQPVQNVVQLVGGNVQNLMQLLTENIDDVITAILNQMGTQGGPPSITQEEVDRIPTKPVVKEMIDDNRSCSICLENFRLGEPFKDLSCSHQFHGSCIDRWLMIHGNCPICRTHFGGGEQNEDDQQQQMPIFGQAFFDQIFQQQQQQQQNQPEQPRQQMPLFFQHAGQRPQIQLATRAQFPGHRHMLFQQQPQQQAQQHQHQHHHHHLQGPTFRFQNGRMEMVSPNAQPNQRMQQQQQPPNPGQPHGIIWSGQVVMNDPAGPSIVLDIQSPNRVQQQMRPGQAGVRPRIVRQVVPRANLPGTQGTPGNQQMPPPNLIQSVLNSVAQAFGRPPGAPNLSNAQPGDELAGNVEPPTSGPTTQQQQQQQPAQNPPRASESQPNLQDNLDVD